MLTRIENWLVAFQERARNSRTSRYFFAFIIVFTAYSITQRFERILATHDPVDIIAMAASAFVTVTAVIAYAQRKHRQSARLILADMLLVLFIVVRLDIPTAVQTGPKIAVALFRQVNTYKENHAATPGERRTAAELRFEANELVGEPGPLVRFIDTYVAGPHLSTPAACARYQSLKRVLHADADPVLAQELLRADAMCAAVKNDHAGAASLYMQVVAMRPYIQRTTPRVSAASLAFVDGFAFVARELLVSIPNSQSDPDRARLSALQIRLKADRKEGTRIGPWGTFVLSVNEQTTAR